MSPSPQCHWERPLPPSALKLKIIEQLVALEVVKTGIVPKAEHPSLLSACIFLELLALLQVLWSLLTSLAMQNYAQERAWLLLSGRSLRSLIKSMATHHKVSASIQLEITATAVM